MQHVSASDIRWEQKLYRRLMFRPGLHRADVIVVNSAYTRELLAAHYGGLGVPVEVIHHGVDLSLFRPGPPLAEEQDVLVRKGIEGPYILFVGQIYPYKLLHILAQAFCRAVAAGGLPHKLVVVGNFSRSDSMGDVYRLEIEQMLCAAGLDGRLVLVQDVTVGELRTVYAGASLYVQSSSAETFGRTVIEAMACGVPVLAARAAATPEILADAGCYYEAHDAEGCASQILAILKDESLQRALRARGLQRAADFSYDIEVQKLIALIHRVAETGGQG
jgi:glycosyltransferase involved in cell wall biosynthesis